MKPINGKKMNTPQSKISKQNATDSKCLMKIAARRYGFPERIKVEISQLIISCVQYVVQKI